MEDPVKTIKINTFSTFILSEKLFPGGKFLFVSSSEVYSGLSCSPFKEEQIGVTNTDHPRSCYIESKRCGEAICNALRSSGVQAKSARLSLAYGPGTRRGDRRVLNSFIERALGGRLFMQDQGLTRRTYCYVSEAVEIMWQILFRGSYPIYNVGGISKTTIRELAQSIGEILDVKVEMPAVNNELPGAPEDVSLDMTRVENEFGKSKYVDLRQGLIRTIDWQKELYR